MNIKQQIAALCSPNPESDILINQEEREQEEVICIDLVQNSEGRPLNDKDGAAPQSSVADVPGPSGGKSSGGKNMVTPMAQGNAEDAGKGLKKVSQDLEIDVQKVAVADNVDSQAEIPEVERSPVAHAENRMPSPKVKATAPPVSTAIPATQPIVADASQEIPVGLEKGNLNTMKRQNVGTAEENTLQKKLKERHQDQFEEDVVPAAQPQHEHEISQTLEMRAPLTQDYNALETQVEPDLMMDIPNIEPNAHPQAENDGKAEVGTNKETSSLPSEPQKMTNKTILIRPRTTAVPVPSSINLIQTAPTRTESDREKASAILSARTLAARRKFQELQRRRREAIQTAAAASTYEEPAAAQASRYPPHLSTSLGRNTDGGLGTQSVRTPSVHANVCLGANTEINRKASGSTLPMTEVHEQTLDPIPASSHAPISRKAKNNLPSLLKSLPRHWFKMS